MLSRLSRRTERGQVLMLAALVLPLLLGMAAIAVDVGGYAAHRRQLQNDADAIALAAARDLPNAANAQTTANSYAVKNNIDPTDMTVTIIPQGGAVLNPTVQVTIQNTHNFTFIGALGVGSKSVSAHAAAIKTSPGGYANLMPWAPTAAARAGAIPGSPVTLKYDANNVFNGNFGAISIDGSGSSVYGTSIQNGTTSVVCAQGVPTCHETSPECNGPSCPTEPGNMVGQTRSGVDYRINNTDADCDTFDEVFTGSAGGPYKINQDCNPFANGTYKSLRVVIVPLVDSFCNGRCNVTITGFALFFLDGYGAGGCTGSSCEITGRFVNADLTTNALAGIFDPNGDTHFVRLSE